MALVQPQLECFIPRPAFNYVWTHCCSFSFESKGNVTRIAAKPQEFHIRREVRQFHTKKLFRSWLCLQCPAKQTVTRRSRCAKHERPVWRCCKAAPDQGCLAAMGRVRGSEAAADRPRHQGRQIDVKSPSVCAGCCSQSRIWRGFGSRSYVSGLLDRLAGRGHDGVTHAPWSH